MTDEEFFFEQLSRQFEILMRYSYAFLQGIRKEFERIFSKIVIFALLQQISDIIP